MWAVAAILVIWQVVLTFALLRSREEERDEVANIGRMAYAFSQMLDRLEHIQASIPPAPPRWNEGYAQGHGHIQQPPPPPQPLPQPPQAHACGHGCSCGYAPAPDPRYHDGYGGRDRRDDQAWGRQASGYGGPIPLDDPPRRRRR